MLSLQHRESATIAAQPASASRSFAEARACGVCASTDLRTHGPDLSTSLSPQPHGTHREPRRKCRECGAHRRPGA